VRVAGPVVALALVALVGTAGVYAVSVQLDESDPSEDLTVAYNVTNVGTDNPETEVQLRVNGTVVDSDRTRPLGELVFDTGELTYDGVGTVGSTVTFNVSVLDTDGAVNRSGAVAVVADAQPTTAAPVDGFAVTVANSSATVATSENVTLTATIENTANSTDTQTVTASADGQTNSTSVTLGAGNSTTVSLAVGPLDSPGRFDGEVTSADDSDTVPVLVTGETGFTPVIVTADAPDEVNGSSAAAAAVSNGVETVVSAVPPVGFVVTAIGVIGFIVGAVSRLRGGRGGGR